MYFFFLFFASSFVLLVWALWWEYTFARRAIIVKGQVISYKLSLGIFPRYRATITYCFDGQTHQIETSFYEKPTMGEQHNVGIDPKNIHDARVMASKGKLFEFWVMSFFFLGGIVFLMMLFYLWQTGEIGQR